jgi:hypothetical protein
MKSVPNLIFYLHEFFQNFSQSLAICFELFSFGVIFNLEIADERAPPVRRRAPRPARLPIVSRRARPPRSRRCSPDRLAYRAIARTAAVPCRLAHRSPIAVAPRRRLLAGEPPFPAVSRAPAPCFHRLIEQRHCRAAPSPCSAAAARSCHAPRTWAVPAPCRGPGASVAAGHACTVRLGRA